MSKAWIRAKRMEFARDVMRDFCLVTRALEDAFCEFETAEVIAFETLHDLVGEEMNKGLLWRLKDTAHHLFRNDPAGTLIGKFLDWALGYIFHETMKLKEDAYQHQNYAPWFQALERHDLLPMERSFSQELIQVLSQTRESIIREIRRIRFITQQCRGMLPIYYARYRNNPLLARFLFAQNELVRAVFLDSYPALIDGVYGEEPELMFILAAQSLRQGGWTAEAAKAAEEALKSNPENGMAHIEKKLLEVRKTDRNPRRTRQT